MTEESDSSILVDGEFPKPSWILTWRVASCESSLGSTVRLRWDLDRSSLRDRGSAADGLVLAIRGESVVVSPGFASDSSISKGRNGGYENIKLETNT